VPTLGARGLVSPVLDARVGDRLALIVRTSHP
jgi:hypothetical protein